MQWLLIVPFSSQKPAFFFSEKKTREETWTCSLSLHLQIASSACIVLVFDPLFQHPDKHGRRLHSDFFVHIIY
jgi:hypothetical protein